MASQSEYKVYHCEFNGRLTGSVGPMKQYKVQVHCNTEHILPILYKHYANVVLLRVFDTKGTELEVSRSATIDKIDNITQDYNYESRLAR